MKLQKILIVNPFGIGDVLFTTPLLAALKDRWPGVAVAYVGNARTAPILRNDPRIDKVFVYERDEFVAVYRHSPWQFFLKWKALVDDIRRERFDLAFDLSLGSPVGIALVAAGVPGRLGYNYKGRGRWLTHSLPLKGYEGRHVAEYYLDLLELVDSGTQDTGHKTQDTGHKTQDTRHKTQDAGRVLSLETQSEPSSCVLCPVSGVPRMDLFTSPADVTWAQDFMRSHGLKPGDFIIIYPGGGASWGAGAGLKRWPAENYAKLADKIVEKASCPIILMGNQGERDLCHSVAEGMSSRPVVAAGETSLGQAAALMKASRLVIANDGGPLHMAVAAGVRTLSVFGPVDEDVYGPFPKNGHVVATKDLPCRPCYRRFRMSDCRHQSCLRDLGVEEVFTKMKELL